MATAHKAMPPIAVVNCHLHLDDEDIISGVVLIEQGIIIAVGSNDSIALPPDTRLLDAERGLIAPGRWRLDGEIEDIGAILHPQDEATLLCRTRFGEIVWAMEKGVITHSSDIPPSSQRWFWMQQRNAALRNIAAYLKRRSESLYVRRTDAARRYQERGVDLLWRFRKPQNTPETISIHVLPAFITPDDALFWPDKQDRRPLPGADLRKLRVDWIFFVNVENKRLYALPFLTFQRWLLAHYATLDALALNISGVAPRFPGRAIPIARLRTDIRRMRILSLTDDTPPTASPARSTP